MKITTQQLGSCELEITVELEPERVEAAKKSAARRLSQKRKIPGFRPGKAPYDIVAQHVGEDLLLSSAADDLGQKIYREALEQEAIDPYAPGALVDVQWTPTPTFKYTVPLKPEVDLGEYRNVRLAFPEVTISDEALNETLEHLREHQAVLEPVERPAEMGDVVTADVKGTLVSADGSDPSQDQFLLDDQGVSVLLDPKVEWPVPGFAEKLVDITNGEERQVELAFPDDYANESLQGKIARFTVQCQAVKSRFVPEWDDDLAKALGDYADLLDLRVKVRQELQQPAERQARTDHAQAVVDVVVAGATMQYHASMLKRQVSEMVDDLDRRLREQKLTLKEYLKIENKTEEALRQELRPRAEQRLKRGLVLGEVVEAEGLAVESSEVDRQIEALSETFSENADQIRAVLTSDTSKRSIALDLLTVKAIARLVAIAQGKHPPLPETQAATESTPEPVEGESETQGIASPTLRSFST